MGDPTDLLLHSVQALLSQLSARVIELDPATEQELATLAGQVVEIQCSQPETAWHLMIEPDRIHLANGPADKPNVILKGSAQTLLHALLTRDTGWPLEIEGDTALLMKLQSLMRGFSPDLAKPAAQALGQDNAQRLTALLEMGLATASNLFGSAKQQTQDTAADLLGRRYSTTSEVHALQDRLDQLRLRVDRLQARLDLLAGAGRH